jgi:hypothetical protein
VTSRPASPPTAGRAAVIAAGLVLAACASPRAASVASAPAPAPAAADAPVRVPEPVPEAVEAAVPPLPVWTPPDRSQPPWSQTRVAPIAQGAVLRERVEGGEHLRIGTDHGVVHAWRPRGYRHKTAGTVIYLHGYYTDVDQAWVDHRLAEQFRRSGRNALFLAVEAPSWNGEEPFWPTVDALFAAVKGVAGLRVPGGPLVVAGHSGAFRGIVPWLVDPRIAEVVLLDGLYQDEQSFAAWLDGAPRGTRRLVLVGIETAARSEAWIPTRPGSVTLPRVPAPDRGLRKAERAAPVLYMRSRQDHMAIIARGEVLPLLLRSGRLGSNAVGKP